MANYRLHPITWKNVIDYNWLRLQITITPCMSESSLNITKQCKQVYISTFHIGLYQAKVSGVGVYNKCTKFNPLKDPFAIYLIWNSPNYSSCKEHINNTQRLITNIIYTKNLTTHGIRYNTENEDQTT